MGLFSIQLKRGAAEKIPATMTSLGLAVIRVEQRENGTHYFYKEAKRQREFAFWVHPDGVHDFWFSGISSSAKRIAAGFSAAGLFEDEDGTKPIG